MKILRLLTPFITSFVLNPTAAIAGEDPACANPPIDSIFIVGNSLREPPARQEVAGDLYGLIHDLEGVSSDVTNVAIFDFQPKAALKAYGARRDSAKLITFYVHDNQQTSTSEDFCNERTKDLDCKDWEIQTSWLPLMEQLALQSSQAPQLVRIVHFQNGAFSSEGVHSLFINGKNILKNESFSEAVEMLIQSVLPEGCEGPGPIIGV